MPSIPDIPGRSLIGGTTRRARVLAGAAAGGALVVGGVVAKRLLGPGDAEEGRATATEPADEVTPIAKAKAAKSKPAAKPPEAAVEPGNRSHDKGPHEALNNPVGDPDETEYPDPYETRPDPRDPVDPDAAPFGEEPHPATGAESTSEPPLESDPTNPGGGRPPRRKKLDE
ncbi:MAG TPA: hypothetical protein VHA76_00420 [Solirubrobacterales bacterium]|nr:hypothetical protein [Solirubrobacterales bacterium]